MFTSPTQVRTAWCQHRSELPTELGPCTVQMIENNLWQLAPPEPPTPQEEAEEARRQQALKVRLPCASSCLHVLLKAYVCYCASE